MKKVLSVFMAVLMMFTALTMSSSATSSTSDKYFSASGTPASYDQAVLVFDFNGGTSKYELAVYDFTYNSFTYTSGVSGTYYMIPQNSLTMLYGYYVSLPVVTAPSGYQFDGWYCYEDGQTYGAGGSYKIVAVNSLTNFVAAFSPAEYEEDTMTVITGILSSVIGTIIGLLFYNDAEAGQSLIEELIGGMFS